MPARTVPEKSTVTRGFNIIGEYINADEIKKKEKCTDLEAAVIATSLRETAVRSRYKRSLANLSELLKFCDVVNVVDNSTDKAELIISMKDRKIVIHECRNWDEEKLQRLVKGNL